MEALTVQSQYEFPAFSGDGTLCASPELVFGPTSTEVDGFAPTVLAASGSPAPTYILLFHRRTVPVGYGAVEFMGNGIAFDAVGNLWSASNGYIAEFAAAPLHASGPQVDGFQAYPASSYTNNVTATFSTALAFEGAGDLVTNATTNMSQSAQNVHYYAAGQFGSASPTAATGAFAFTAAQSSLGDSLVRGPYIP